MTAIGGVTKGTRSEERRVGKEGRFRGAPDHLKKKKRHAIIFHIAFEIHRRKRRSRSQKVMAAGMAARRCCQRVAGLHGGLLETFFFFQAEDGIRDYKVTGVQTCALPI